MKKVCVVGAGPSGLVTIKELLKEGMDVKCYESENRIGGAFRSIENGGRSYDSLLLTVSNYFMAYSDFMPKKNQERRYWSVDEYREYLEEYAKKFNLLNHINFSHSISSSFIKDGKIIVNILKDSKEYTESFDHIIICTGSNFTPKIPLFDNENDFKGEILHSREYINNKKFTDKEVLCIGLGESGADIVHEISQVSNCNVLVNDYPNVVPRWINGFTNDAYTSHCLYALKKKGIDTFMRLKSKYYLKFNKKLKESDRLVQKLILERESFMSKFLTKNDVFIDDVVAGKVNLIKDSVQSFTEKGIRTKGGKEINADIILCNTGYKTCFKQYDFGEYFLDPRKLFKHMIHSDYGTLVSVIGWARPSQGGLPACSEMQARYISKLISGKLDLPNVSQLKQTIKEDAEYYNWFFDSSKNIKSLVSYHDFMISMAELIGCKPKLFNWNDLKLTKKMFFGSHLPSFYRLNDSNFKNEAENLIKTLPNAYSNRRLIVVVLLIFLYNPLFWIKGYSNGYKMRNALLEK